MSKPSYTILIEDTTKGKVKVVRPQGQARVPNTPLFVHRVYTDFDEEEINKYNISHKISGKRVFPRPFDEQRIAVQAAKLYWERMPLELQRILNDESLLPHELQPKIDKLFKDHPDIKMSVNKLINYVKTLHCPLV
jgi:hypothetical protein